MSLRRRAKRTSEELAGCLKKNGLATEEQGHQATTTTRVVM